MAASIEPRRLAATLAASVAFSWIGCIVVMFRNGAWILDEKGRPVVTDFIEVWAAGRTVVGGAAASAYDPKLHHAAQVAVVGHPFHGYLWWHYPPFVLFAAALLALLPYAAAFLAWVVATLVPYVAAVGSIARSRFAAVVACASPAVFANACAGQNGFVTAALVGAVLLNLEAKPILSGLCLGLLTYKPQFGLLFPLVLVADGRWRAIATAAVTATALLLASWIAFGSVTLLAFWHYLPLASQSLLVKGAAGWNKLQSIYGLARCLGAGNTLASALQAFVLVATAALLVWLWRTRASYATKAAALSAAVLLATPYAYMYDLPLLSIPLAFLWRERPFDNIELAGVSAACLCLALFAFGILVWPVGPFAVAFVIALVVRRVGLAQLRQFDAPHALPRLERAAP